MADNTKHIYENESDEYWDPQGHDPLYEPWDEALINEYLERLTNLEFESLKDTAQALLKYSAWGVGLSFAYVRFLPEFEFTGPSVVLFCLAWLCWFVAFGYVLYSYYETGLFSWFNQSVGLYRRYLPGMFWVYREKFYFKVLVSLVAFGLGFLFIVAFVVLDQYEYIVSLFWAPSDED